jgi:hypothetical protein
MFDEGFDTAELVAVRMPLEKVNGIVHRAYKPG